MGACENAKSFLAEIKRVRAIIDSEVRTEFAGIELERYQVLEQWGHCPCCHYHLVDPALRRHGVMRCNVCYGYQYWSQMCKATRLTSVI